MNRVCLHCLESISLYYKSILHNKVNILPHILVRAAFSPFSLDFCFLVLVFPNKMEPGDQDPQKIAPPSHSKSGSCRRFAVALLGRAAGASEPRPEETASSYSHRRASLVFHACSACLTRNPESSASVWWPGREGYSYTRELFKNSSSLK